MTPRVAILLVVVTLLAAAGAIWWQEAYPCVSFVETPTVRFEGIHSGPTVQRRCVR